MTSRDDELHLVRMAFDSRRLYLEAQGRRVPLHEIDIGYLLHCRLTDMFGAEAPKPFCPLDRPGAIIEVWGYARRSADELAARISGGQTRGRADGFEWSQFASRTVPDGWYVGQQVGFSLRACPVQRMAGSGPRWGKGAEVDVFLAHCWRDGEGQPVDRSKVYGRWLEQCLAAAGGAQLERVRLVAFHRERLYRKMRGGPGRRVERPVAWFKGVLQVTDPGAFRRLLARGVGRHRAFGFGMLLLEPVRRE